jgi:two-component sensor histidine kinase
LVVSTLEEIAQLRTTLPPQDVAWLQAVVTDWQIVADLAFSDLVLWIPDAEEKGYWAAAQVRPATGPTTLLVDVVGSFQPVGTEFEGLAVAVTVADQAIGIVEVRASGTGARVESALEAAYRDSAEDLLGMIGRGEFPHAGARSELADSLRVGDGFVRLRADGVVEYASPNALSAYRRLGLVEDLAGADLGTITAGLVDAKPTHRGVRGVLQGREPAELEVEGEDVSVALRLIPLLHRGAAAGAIVLLRDVTDVRRRERQLVSKEATIREIHHRVKNNLQTVAALLRLQGRRMESPAAREALDDAVRRVGSIALVHETLSQSFDEMVAFDDIADQLLRSVLDVAGDGAHGRVVGERVGDFGSLPGETATVLAMVLTELIQNAAQHAYPERSPRQRSEGGAPTGRLTVAANRIRDRLRVRVSDDGVGMPADLDTSASLGLSIVRTLVESELKGTLAFERGRSGGTTVAISLEL